MAALTRRARLASQNANKLAELRAALPGWELEPLVADGWPDETGATYEENARLKARFGRTLAGPGEWVLGEDSGIECDALGGAPGLHSARWAPRGDQADALLERLGDEPNRRARMVAALVALAPDGEELRRPRRARGRRSRASGAATGGFGYDPIFVPAGEERTVAELGDDWKRDHSHRGRAARALEAALERGGTVAPTVPFGRVLGTVPGTCPFSRSRYPRPLYACCRSGAPVRSGRVPGTVPGHGSRRRVRLAPRPPQVPVDLGAEHGHVCHHVEPDEQQRLPRERLQHRVVARHAGRTRGSSWKVASRITAAATAPGSTSRQSAPRS